MAKEFFGYERSADNKTVLSTDFAIISIAGSGRMGLVQEAQAQYEHRVEPRFEAGSSDLFWLNGQPQGQITFSRVIGTDGIFADIKENGCAELQTLTINTSGNSCGISTGGNGVTFDGAMLQSVTLTFNVQQLDIRDNIVYKVATMTV